MKTNNYKRFLSVIMLLSIIIISFSGCKSINTSSEVDTDTSSMLSSASSDDAENTSSEEQHSDVQSTIESKPKESSSQPILSTPYSSTPVPSAPVENIPPKTETPIVPETPTQKTPQELIVGKWITLVDISPFLDGYNFDPKESICISYFAEFTSSGTMIMSVSESSLFQIMYKTFSATVDKELENSTMTRKEFEDKFFEEYGMTPWDYCSSVAKELAGMLYDVGKYKFEGDTLYFSSSNSTEFTVVDYSFYNDDVLYITQEGETVDFSRF